MNCDFDQVDLFKGTPESVLKKIERVVALIKDNRTQPFDNFYVQCHPVFYQMLREAMWKSAAIKYRGRWRAHKQQGITSLSRRQWIMENY